MPDLSILLLSGDEGLVSILQGLLPDTDLVSVSCLAQTGTAPSALWLVIDPRWVKPCCLDRLAAWRRTPHASRVAFLPFPAAPEVLLALPRIIPGIVTSPEGLRALISSRLRPGRSRAAWEARDSIFGREDYPPLVRALLRFTREHDHDGYSVPEATAALETKEGKLRRLALRWVGYPPGVLLDLARIMSVASNLRKRRDSLEVIAREHKFPHSAAMSRMFLGFVSLRPGAFRQRFGPGTVSETGMRLDEIGSRPTVLDEVVSNRRGSIHRKPAAD